MRILSFLCPFLYLTATLTSILNGLGHTVLTFIQNLTALFIRILFVFLLVPRFGIKAYLWSLLASQLTGTLLNFFFLHRKVSFSFYPYRWIILPFAAVILSCGIGLFMFLRFSNYSIPSILNLVLSLLSCAICYLITLFFMNLLHFHS